MYILNGKEFDGVLPLERKGIVLRIQIVEDDRALSDGIVLAIQEQGMDMVQSATLREAKEAYEQHAPDMVILDINLPDGSGYDYLKWIRGQSQIPVLVLTANDMEMDEVMGLTLGADDYMTKPFSLAVLRARIGALCRRIQSQKMTVYEKDLFHFDFERLYFSRDGQEISLSINEQRLLRMLVENEGHLLTREVLMSRIWDDSGDYVDENALSVTVNRLRSKLEDREESVTYIQTVYGQGYLWKKTQ